MLGSGSDKGSGTGTLTFGGLVGANDLALPKAVAGAKASLLATAKRQDGRKQVRYGGHLLYTYVGARSLGLPPRDRKPGDVNGQGVIGAWWVLSPAGKPIKKTP